MCPECGMLLEEKPEIGKIFCVNPYCEFEVDITIKKEKPLDGLRLAIAKASGEITCSEDLHESIRFHNEFAKCIKYV